MAVAADFKKNFPTIVVVLGASGDLMRRKIIPALFDLFIAQKLPPLFRVIGFSRRSWTTERFTRFIERVVRKQPAPRLAGRLPDFLKLFTFQQGRFNRAADYHTVGKRLAAIEGEWGVCCNKLFYLAAPPEHYRTLVTHLARAGLTRSCSPEEGWTRVLIEKPFGKDLADAYVLDKLIGQLFKEAQIYRIDHYLAKEMIQTILSFRFSNNFLENNWNNRGIESISLRLNETVGVEKRGAFYDGVGALRDVGQNHLLQMLALVTMDEPRDFAADSIRAQRAAVLNRLHLLSAREALVNTLRAQYQGYRRVAGVKKKSATETYFKIKTEISSPRWHGVPITLESGKRLNQAVKEVVITFRHPLPCHCPPRAAHRQNQIRISLAPAEGISITFWSKKPGFEFHTEKQAFNFSLRRGARPKRYSEEYAKLLLDCIAGDQTLFVSTAEVEAMWRAIDPIIKAWQGSGTPLHSYPPGTATVTRWPLPSETPRHRPLPKEIGLVGLGKMGSSLARRLLVQNWRVVGYNRSPQAVKALKGAGLVSGFTLKELVEQLPKRPRVLWLMLPAGQPVDAALFGTGGLASLLQRGDIVIDGGNSYYRDTLRRARALARRGIRLMDVGVSGGPVGAQKGACLMIGGTPALFSYLEPLFAALAAPVAYRFFPHLGAGHFVKMIHNGIEYGMMQAIAEGFTMVRRSPWRLNVQTVADIYNHGSVVESRLVAWLHEAFIVHGDQLTKVTGRVAHTGEAAWAVREAAARNIQARVIREALRFRRLSARHPGFTGKILSALRQQFGGHAI